MRRVFVYEYLSGGGTMGDDPHAADDLMPMGVAMRDAMVADLLRSADCAVSVATCERSAPAVRGAAAVMPQAGESPQLFVARQAQRHDVVWLVAPETDGLLAAFAAATAPRQWLGCDARSIALTASKRATVEHLAAHGVTTPLAWLDDAAALRWVVKPDDGAGALDTRVHAGLAAARGDQAARTPHGAWLEPWIDGEALSLSLLCGPGRAELLSVNRQRIVVDADGLLHFAGVDVNVVRSDDARRPALASFAAQVARALPGLRGFVGIDLVWHARRGPVLIEVNPRVTCAYVGLSASLGRNLADELLASAWPEAAHA